MKRTIFFAIVLLASIVLACNFSASTANITEAKMAKDPDGNQPTTIFAQDDTFHCVVEVANAPDDTKVKAVWTAVEADGVDPDFVIGEKELVGGGTLKFSVSNTGGQLWPAGKYKVDLYLNDELDRTLDFEVEGGAVAEEPTATPEPTATSEPEPSPTPEPTEETENSVGDSLAGDTIPAEPTEEEEFEPLPFQPEPYVHPSGAFTFIVPEGWEPGTENETVASFAGNDSLVGAEFVDAGFVYNEDQMQKFIDLYLKNFILSGEYEVLGQEVQPDDSIYVAVTFKSPQGKTADLDLFFEQRETVMFVLYFSTFTYDEMKPTWHEIIGSYEVDPEAALAAAPAAAPTATPKPAPPPPTPTSAPATNPFKPQPGRSRLYVFNEYGQEITFTIANQEHKIPTGTPDDAKPIDLDPGKYTFTVSIPGGAANGEVELGADQSWAVGVRGDGAVYNPFQVYP